VLSYQRGDLLSSEQAQELALAVALKGSGFVSPNPLVGCVIVDSEHRLLTTGHHAQWGGPHAEADAFSKLPTSELRGSTVYVTLEPCSHHGKTPPCADLFLDKGIRKVVVGLRDPNPLVAGKGIERLRHNKIEVVTDAEFSRRSARVAEIFLWHIQKKIPFVALKVAISANGKIAGEPGTSPWITSVASRLCARALRAGYDATMIGAETFLQDNPLLDFRETRWENKKNPKVVILDPRGRAEAFFPQSHLAKIVKLENVFFVKKVDEECLRDLYQKGIYSLYVEGGAKTHALFVEKALYQKIYCFQSSQVLQGGLAWNVGLDTTNLEGDSRLTLEKTETIGPDRLMVFYPK
jgi:diaminohydroxyphosphoribosylaminopyrimidine deaminase/5-amino-6-(5-phosphoribosylamino)uracil reductase